MRKIIPLCIPEIKGNEWRYIKECLDTNWVSSVGKFVEQFEEKISQHSGARYAVATTNGTAALHISLLVSGVKPDDEVLVPTLTFISPVNTIRYVKAYPVFMDVNSFYQIDEEKMIDFIKKECKWINSELRNKTTNRRIKAILPVDIMGHPINIDPIKKIAQKYNIIIIEDASEALGARYKEKKVGTLGDIGCYSFNGNKIITTGGGGMIITDNEKWAEKARYLTTQAKDDPLEYIHKEVGYNYRLTNIQAAMGVAQLELLDEYVEIKRKHALFYNEGFNGIGGITMPKEASWAFSTYWLYTILIDKKKYGIDSRELMMKLRDDRIECRPFWHPIHSLSLYRKFQSYKIQEANLLYEKGLSLPSSVSMKDTEMNYIIDIIKNEKR